jgi:hypothetical protein
MTNLMSQQFIKKNVKLNLEFDNYIARHPELFESIPDGATIIMTLKGDNEFNDASFSIVRNSRSRRPVVEAQKEGSHWSVQPLQLKAA